MRQFRKGSEWRRWDLHIHTPGTKKNDQFDGVTIAEEWQKYINDINGYEGEIAAIGITDYCCIDNYFVFKKYMSDGTVTKNILLVLPNIELRMMPVTGSSIAINIHCLFNPAFENKIKERFLNKLKFDNGDRKYSASRTDLIEFGRKYKNNHNISEEEAIKVAIGQFVISINDLKELFQGDQELKNNSLIIVANSSTDGLSGLKDHCDLIQGIQFASLDATRQTVYKFSQGIFSGNEKDAKYFAGLGVDSVEEVKRKCFSLKPCFHGSDAHQNVKIFEPDLKRYCWVKSNPTFNGLKQTLYEPSSRVKIQEEIPEEKKNYLIIDSVKFITTDNAKQFSAEAIELNDKLNAIIGGKSSGKSLLLYYIAKTIDPAQVEYKLEELQQNSQYEFDKKAGFDFEVVWKDGLVNSLHEEMSNKTRQITYVPQMYINYLAERRGKDGLKKLIQSFLEEKDTFKSFYSDISQKKDDIKTGLTNSLILFFQLRDQQLALIETIKGKGDKQARAKNLLEKQQELANLRIVAGFTEEDELRFSVLETQRNRLGKRLSTFQSLYNIYQNSYPIELQKMLNQLENSYNTFFNNNKGKFSIHPAAGLSLSKHIDNDKLQTRNLFQAQIATSLAKAQRIQKLINTITESMGICETNLKPLLDKIQNRSRLLKVQEEIVSEQNVINQIFDLENEFEKVKNNRTNEYQKIKTYYFELLNVYIKIVAEINNNPVYSQISAEKGIQLKAFVDFDTSSFNAACTNFINKQSYFSSQFGNYFDGNNQYVFDEVNHLKNIDEIFLKIQKPQQYNIRFNQGGTVDNITRGLLDDYFSISFELSQDNEDILKMSPGKKGLILLFLILHLSNADYPILIDQPEDNLDNRTVYTELKDFMKMKKIERQILIVTHNANLVVTTDAENVIVANQDGQDQGKENETYQFEYDSGALEDSFRDQNALGVLKKMGIKEHVCEILEGGEAAFIEREKRYALSEL